MKMKKLPITITVRGLPVKSRGELLTKIKTFVDNAVEGDPEYKVRDLRFTPVVTVAGMFMYFEADADVEIDYDD